MDHLFVSVVKVLRPGLSRSKGVSSYVWQEQAAPLDYVPCRIDLNFLRPGKDTPMPAEAGKAPDHLGVFFCAADVPVMAGDRIVAIPNDSGEIVVPGTFEIRPRPDQAIDYGSVHHIEVQIVEVSQNLTDYPSEVIA